MKRNIPAIAGLLVLGLSGSLAAEVSVSPVPFGAVRAGEVAKTPWTGLPEGVQELELLLSVEGRQNPVRLTPQWSPRAGLLLWRVPNLPSRRARLSVRFGLDGEEVESAAGAPFEILGVADAPPSVLAFRDGEWWTQESAEDRFPGTLESREKGDRIGENREAPPCAGSSHPIPEPGGAATRGAKSETLPEAGAGARPVFPRKPVEVPARI